MVARAASAAGPVLLACRQWDPRELARRLPSRGAGAWPAAPLLPSWVQCPGRVCAALAAGSGGLGPVPGVVSSPFPPSCPTFPALCVAGRSVRVSLILAHWYAIPCGLCVPRARSGCPSGIPRVSFVCVCARALAASAPPPLPGLVWRLHLARSRCWALVGPFHAVRAPPRVLPRSRAPFGFLRGRGGGPVSPLPGFGLCASLGAGQHIWGVPTPGGGGGGGGPRAVLPAGAAWGASGVGGRLTSVRPSAFPEQATKRVSLASLWPWRAWPPYRSGSCSHAVPGRGPCGVLVRWRGFACPSRFLREQAAGGVEAGPGAPPTPSPGRRGPSRGRGDRPLCFRGGGGPAPPWPADRRGGVG